jgi:hypothetical protein
MKINIKKSSAERKIRVIRKIRYNSCKIYLIQPIIRIIWVKILRGVKNQKECYILPDILMWRGLLVRV